MYRMKMSLCMKYGNTSTSLVPEFKQCRGHHEKVWQLSPIKRMMGRELKDPREIVGGMPNSQQYTTSTVC